MRKTSASSNAACSVALSARADSRSRPKGFSMMRRALRTQPERSSPSTTVGNTLGGIAR